jgi:hypothetical protein
MLRPYRLITALYFDLGRLPGRPPDSNTALVVGLKPDGTHANRGGKNTGAPRPPKRRAIDLRPGDQLLCEGQWRTIRHVEAFRDCWLTEEQADAHRDRREGYLYRPAYRRAPTRSREVQSAR